MKDLILPTPEPSPESEAGVSIMSDYTSVELLCMYCMTTKNSHGICHNCGFDENNYQPSPHHLPFRTILNGKYLIGRVLGEGGFGITYLGWDLNLDLRIAIKEFYPTGFATRENKTTNTVLPYTGEKSQFFQNGREKFIDEAKRLAKFYALPGIVSIKDFFLENGTAYIVMEFIDGQTLKQYLQTMGGIIPTEQMLDMMKPLMKSLSEIHKAGIIHRDISPDNIMITKDGYIKLLDFGAARDFAESGNKSLSVMLKPGYAPEEQYRSKGIQGPWTDVYALCASIYKAITGITPDESSERLRHDEIKKPSQLGISISSHQEVALMKGLSVLQEHRFQSIKELSESLYYEASLGVADELIRVGEQRTKAEIVEPDQPLKYNRSDAKYREIDVEAAYKFQDENQVNEPAANHTFKANRKFLMLAVLCCACFIVFIVFNNRDKNEGITYEGEPSMIEVSSAVDESAGEDIQEDVTSDSIDWSLLETTDVAQNYYGNSIGNISNDGEVVGYGDWIFYNWGGLYRINKDDSQNTLISTDEAMYISVVDNWVYYCHGNLYGPLCKMRPDGTDKIILDSSECCFVNVVGNWIYYRINFEGIYKIKTDGTGKALLLSSNASEEDDWDTLDEVYVYDNWIFYTISDTTSDNPTGSLNKMTLDGEQNTCVIDEWISNVNIEDGWTYYVKVQENNTFTRNLYKARIDGTEITKLNELNVGNVNVSGDWIYYNLNESTNGILIYKTRTDGSELTLVTKRDKLCGYYLVEIIDGELFDRSIAGQ